MGDAPPPKYPGPQTPHTPTSESGMYPGDGPATPSSQDKNSRFPAPSPSPADPRFPVPASPGGSRLPGGMTPSHNSLPGGPGAPGAPGGGMPGPDNMPLNPGTPNSQNPNTNIPNKGFDPI